MILPGLGQRPRPGDSTVVGPSFPIPGPPVGSRAAQMRSLGGCRGPRRPSVHHPAAATTFTLALTSSSGSIGVMPLHWHHTSPRTRFPDAINGGTPPAAAFYLMAPSPRRFLPFPPSSLVSRAVSQFPLPRNSASKPTYSPIAPPLTRWQPRVSLSSWIAVTRVQTASELWRQMPFLSKWWPRDPSFDHHTKIHGNRTPECRRRRKWEV
jgi:hypothetical protein